MASPLVMPYSVVMESIAFNGLKKAMNDCF